MQLRNALLLALAATATAFVPSHNARLARVSSSPVLARWVGGLVTHTHPHQRARTKCNPPAAAAHARACSRLSQSVRARHHLTRARLASAVGKQ